MITIIRRERDTTLMTDAIVPLERTETGIRILLTVLFAIVVNVRQTVVAVVVLFSLAFALIIRRPPGERVREFANRVISYWLHILRYLTYNEETQPFPFSDFPPEIGPLAHAPSPRSGTSNTR